MEHLDDNAASEFVSGSLPSSALGRVEGHLAACRDCRALVAALAGGPGEDSDAATFRHERISPSQVGELPKKTLAVGDRVGRYLVLSSLGAGGMGVVFAAYDPQLDRKVALKLLRSGLAGSSKDARARLRREAKAIAQLSHPHVVSVYDVGATDDGDLYIAMEFVEGDTLTTWLRKYPRSWREIIDVFLQAARGLASAHDVGLLHRDFKPDNVLVGGDGRVRVTDFGLARSLLAPDEAAQVRPAVNALDAALTATGTVLGTPRYMPPEQMTGHDLDARSDQFSFCVALYEALYGTHPLRDGSAVSMLDHGERAIPPPEGTKIPPAIGRAVLRGLERDRAKRFPSMGALIHELLPRPRRSPLRYAGVAFGALLLIGGTTVAVVAQQQRAPSGSVMDAARVQALEQEKQRLEIERQQLIEQARQPRVDDAELGRLRAALQQKDAEILQKAAEIQTLNETVSRLAAENAELISKRSRPAAPSASSLLLRAMATVQGPVEGCFDEWAERIHGTRAEVSDATMVIVLTVTPEGLGTQPRIVRSPEPRPAMTGDGEAPGMSVLELCVSEQVARASWPAGPDQLEIEATVLWSHGLVNLSPKVIARHPAPPRQIELR